MQQYYYTLNTYFHYVGIADSIKYLALDLPYKKDFENIWGTEARDGRSYEVNLSKLIYNKEKNYSNSLLKRIIKHKSLFVFGYFLALLALTIIVFWSIIPFLIAIIIPVAITIAFPSFVAAIQLIHFLL